MSIRDTYLAKKSLIASNLTSKGVEADSSMGLTTLANKILLVEDNLYSGTTDVSVRAVWEDDNNSKSIRPNTLKVALIGSDGSYRSIQLNTSNSWQHTFTDIPQKYNNQNILYTVDAHETSHYGLSINGTQTEEYVITNTLLTGNLTVAVTVEGVPENTDISNLLLNISGPDVSTPIQISLGQMNNGSFELTNLLEGTYSIICSNFDLGINGIYLLGDSVLGSSANIEYGGNTTARIHLHYSYEKETPPEEETRIITVSITFDDNNNQDGNRPDSVTVYLYADDSLVDDVTIGETEGWSYTFTDLPIYNNGGEEIYYAVQQSAAELYTSTVNGYSIENTYTPETTKATVRKIWDDNNDAQGLRPSSITMILSNGQSVTLNDTNYWTATIDNLPTKLNGESVTYTWTEETVSGYTPSNTTTNGITTTFTNALETTPTPPEANPK